MWINKFQVIPGVEITVGQDKEDGGRWPYAGTAGAVEQMGAKHVNKDVHISFIKFESMTFCSFKTFALIMPQAKQSALVTDCFVGFAKLVAYSNQRCIRIYENAVKCFQLTLFLLDSSSCTRHRIWCGGGYQKCKKMQHSSNVLCFNPTILKIS